MVELPVEHRAVRGKKVRFLRRQGIVPANVYGHRIASTAVQVAAAPLSRILAQDARNALITLRVTGEPNLRTVMVRAVQRNPLDGALLHIDFYQVQMTEKIRTEVHVVLVGEAPAVEVHRGVLLQGVSSVTIECLPGDMPSAVEVDVSGLAELDQALRVKDLVLDSGVTVLTDPEQVLAHVVHGRVEAEPEPATAEGVAVETGPSDDTPATPEVRSRRQTR